MVVMPNPLDSWLTGWLSLVLGWSIICLIKQDRYQIIELLTGFSELHLSSDSARAPLKSYPICFGGYEILMRVEIKSGPFIYLTDSSDVS